MFGSAPISTNGSAPRTSHTPHAVPAVTIRRRPPVCQAASRNVGPISIACGLVSNAIASSAPAHTGRCRCRHTIAMTLGSIINGSR